MARQVFGDLDRVVVCHELPVSVLVERASAPDLNRIAVCSRAVRRMTDKRWHISRIHLKMTLPGSMAIFGAAVRAAWWNVGISGLDDEQVVEHVRDLREYFRVDDHLDVAEVRVVRHFELDRETSRTTEQVLVMPTVRSGLDRIPITLEDPRSSTLRFDPADHELYDAVAKATATQP